MLFKSTLQSKFFTIYPMGNFTINFPQGITLNHDLFLINQSFLPGNLFIKKKGRLIKSLTKAIALIMS